MIAEHLKAEDHLLRSLKIEGVKFSKEMLSVLGGVMLCRAIRMIHVVSQALKEAKSLKELSITNCKLKTKGSVLLLMMLLTAHTRFRADL